RKISPAYRACRVNATASAVRVGRCGVTIAARPCPLSAREACRMSLTVCLITRDAEEKLERTLRSVAPLGAELLVADTGSRDGTVQAARALGATAFAVAWQDDFAAAQNAALDRAAGDWVLWLNPDEELLSPGREQFAAMMARPDALAYVARVQEVADPDRIDRATETWQPRLFRRRPELRYVGRLHPHFGTPLQEL